VPESNADRNNKFWEDREVEIVVEEQMKWKLLGKVEKLYCGEGERVSFC
jgi:hypothetical protein